MKNNLKTRQIQRRNKRLCKVLSVILVVLMMISSVIMCVSAASTSWGLETSQIDNSYFYSVGFGGGADSSWSVIRQRCFLNCETLVHQFNSYVVNYDVNFNVIKQLNYCYNRGYRNEALSIATKWNTLRLKIIDTVTECTQIVGYSGSAIPYINGEQVTIIQYQNYYSAITKQYNSLNSLADEAKNLYGLVMSNSTNFMGIMISDTGNLVNFLWSGLRVIITSFGTGDGSASNVLGISFSTYSMKQTADAISGVIKTFAYAIAVVLFGVNVTTTALQNEILTLRGGIKVFARVILVKIWIDLAIPICIYSLNIINKLAINILTSLGISRSTIFSDFNISSSASDTGSFFDKIIGAIKLIYSFFSTVLTGSPMLILAFILCVCIAIVMVKMVARAFELTCLVSISPIFFATLVGEESKRYFQRFMSAFLATSGYIVYVAITYAVASKWVAECSVPLTTFSFGSFYNTIKTALPRAIIIIGCCRVMVKPPKGLLSLTDGG